MEKLLNETQARLSIFRSIIKTIREAGGEINEAIIHHALNAAFGTSKNGGVFTNIFQSIPMTCGDCQCETDEPPTETPKSDE